MDNVFYMVSLSMNVRQGAFFPHGMPIGGGKPCLVGGLVNIMQLLDTENDQKSQI